jgi:hypothetical protein
MKITSNLASDGCIVLQLTSETNHEETLLDLLQDRESGSSSIKPVAGWVAHSAGSPGVSATHVTLVFDRLAY